MSRNRRHVPPNSIHHIVNRGNDKKVIFPEPVDYGSFLALLREGRERYPIDLFSYSLMPNHYHLVVRAEDLDALSAYMHFVQRNHACDLRACYRSRGHGHIFQRRYWSKLIEGEGHLLMVMKYVEANPVRGGLVEWAHEWEWSSLWERVTGERDLLNAWPEWLPEDWPTVVTIPLPASDLDWIRRPTKSGRPGEDKLQFRKMVAGSLIIER